MGKAEGHMVRAAVKLQAMEEILVIPMKALKTVYMQIATKN